MEILIILLLILINGFFSMAEIALVSARKTRLETAAKKGSQTAKVALKLISQPNKLLSTVQIGITLIGLLTGIYSGENITNDVEAMVSNIQALQPYADSIAVVIVLVIVTFFSLVLGELVPKRIGLANPEAISKLAANPMRITAIISAPFVWLLTATSDLLLKILNIKPSLDSKVTEEEIKAIVQEGAEGGEVEQIEQDIVTRVFGLGDRKVSSLMTYRKDVVFLHINDNAETVRNNVIAELHSVYPVFEADKDEVMGVVLLKDLFAHINKPDFALSNYVHTPQYIIEHSTVYNALELFKRTKTHYGIVTDEFGITQGIITMNDILEALVGNADDFSTEEYRIDTRTDGSLLVDGAYPFYDFLTYLDLSALANDYTFNTVAGLFLHEHKQIPQPGDKIQWLNYNIEVVDMDGARIDKVIVKRNGE